MKILLVGLDCAAPELLLEDESLTNFRVLMENGCYGRLESVNPPITIPAWMCMATSQDPGSLGVYGFRNRVDYSYKGLGMANSKSIQEIAIWDQIAMEGKRSVIIGVPPSYPPRRVNGVSVGCFMTPDPASNEYTHPAAAKKEIEALVGDYPVDVKGFRTDNKDWLKDQIVSMTRKHFEVVRHFMKNTEWDYFQFVEIGLDRMHHGFWQNQDKTHVLYKPGNPYENVVRDYYRLLDEELGKIFELLDQDTVILVASDHGAKRLDGGFCVNEWLVREGLLVLNEYPKEVKAFDQLDINWEKTRVWSEGGYYARVFFNVKGREPSGVIEKADYENFRNEMVAKFEALPDDKGKRMGTLVFKPEHIYRNVRNVAPDLIVHFGDLFWRSIGSVGYPDIHVQENDTGPDGCNHAQFGSFILAAPNCPLRGEFKGAHLLNVAPTLLELGGYDTPRSMQGKSLLEGYTPGTSEPASSETEEEMLKERLKGLGYIS